MLSRPLNSLLTGFAITLSSMSSQALVLPGSPPPPLPPITAPVTFHGLGKEILTVPVCGVETTGTTAADVLHTTLVLNADQSMTLTVQDQALSTLFTANGSWVQGSAGHAIKMQFNGQLSQVSAGTTADWATLLNYIQASSLDYCQSRTSTAGTTAATVEPASVRMDENVMLLNKTETGGALQLFIHGFESNDAQSPGTQVSKPFRYKFTTLLGP